MKGPNSSMQLTRASDYGVRAMIHLASKPGAARISLPELARSAEAPESFLSKVLQSLARAEMILSRRGQAGGFEITARGRAATVLEVIEAIDGPICLNICLSTGRDCGRKSWCPTHPVWALAQQALVNVLRGVTVAELVAKPAGSNGEAKLTRIKSGCGPAGLPS